MPLLSPRPLWNEGTGHEPDLHDYRDVIFSAPIPKADIPRVVEQFDTNDNIYYQGSDNACVGFSIKEAVQIRLWHEHALKFSASPGFIWWLGKSALGWSGENRGCRIRDAIRLANEYGVASSGTCPWVMGKYMPPTNEAFDQASDHSIKYSVAGTIDAVRAANALKMPTVFGTVLTESFEKTGRNGGMFSPPEGNPVSSHAMLIVGHDDDKLFPEWGGIRGGFRFRNHYGRSWGDQGWGWLPYKHFESGAVSDTWVVESVAR